MIKFLNFVILSKKEFSNYILCKDNVVCAVPTEEEQPSVCEQKCCEQPKPSKPKHKVKLKPKTRRR